MLLLHDAVKLADGSDHEVRRAAIAFCAEVKQRERENCART